MFNRIPKSQKAYGGNYTCFTKFDYKKWPDVIYIISIDPGIYNFCVRVEERPIRKNIRFVPKMHLYENLRIKKQDNYEDNICKDYQELTDYFDSHMELFQKCHLVIIERQMAVNYKPLRMSQHALSYLMLKLRKDAAVLEIDSKLKTKQLEPERTRLLNKNGIKKWAVEKAKEILKSRNDEESLGIINKNKTKKDDLADTVCQLEAFFILMKWPTTEDILSIPDIVFEFVG